MATDAAESSDDAGSDAMPTLTDVSGIGSSTVSDLEDAGFETVEDIAHGSIEQLAQTDGFGPSRAEDVREAARTVFSDTGDDLTITDGIESQTTETDEPTEQTTDEPASSASDQPSDAVAGDTADVTEYAVMLELSELMYAHTLRALIEESLRNRQRGYPDDESTCIQMANDLSAAWGKGDSVDDGSAFAITLHLEDDQINLLHQALSTTINDYRSKTNVHHLWGDLRSIRDQLESYR